MGGDVMIVYCPICEEYTPASIQSKERVRRGKSQFYDMKVTYKCMECGCEHQLLE